MQAQCGSTFATAPQQRLPRRPPPAAGAAAAAAERRLKWPRRRQRGVACAAAPVQKQQEQQHPTALEPSGAGKQQRALRLVELRDGGQQQTTYSWPPAGAGAAQQQQQQQPAEQQQQQQQQPWRQRLLGSLRALYLPAGYPQSVTDDYLAYQLATVPAHITGWLSISLTTSSLLKAVGFNAGPVGATAAAAAIKWILKDGIGAAGRLLVGGRLGLEFDDDPRRWRMAAEALTTAGLALEVATAAFPSNFLLLASLGNFSKAVGKGMGKPVFRVVQTHFAAAGNVGAVAAKEEVWEVSAQLTGYALSVMLLEALQDAGSWQTVVGLWALVQGVHVTARYWALRQLRFRHLNQKRAALLAAAHASGREVPGVAEGNWCEPMLLPASAVRPRVSFGCGLEQAWGSPPEALPRARLAAWVALFERQGYLMVWRDDQAHVVLKEGCEPQRALLRAMWQAAWLDTRDGGGGLSGGGLGEAAGAGGGEGEGAELELLAASLEALEREYDAFEAAARGKGWDVEQLVFRGVQGTPRLAV